MLAAAGLLAGCVNFDKPIAPPLDRTDAQRNFDALWNASIAVLKDYRFTPVVEDRREGTIVTGPLVGMQWFEFWRKDAVTPADVAESSLQTIYKRATVTIRPAPDSPGAYVAAVTVEVQRSDKPAMVVTNTSEAYGLFTMTGGRSRWVTNFGRGEEVEAEDADQDRKGKPTPAAVLRPTGEPAATQKSPAAATWRVPLGRDAALEKQMAARIAAAAGSNPIQKPSEKLEVKPVEKPKEGPDSKPAEKPDEK